MKYRLLVLWWLGGCTAAEPPVDLSAKLPPWERGLPASGTLGPARRGLRVVRGIIHLHSVFSHDACDGQPQPDGKPNAPCLQHLRDALCETRQDFALLTEHADNMTRAPFEDLLLPAAGSEPDEEGGRVVARRMACPAPGQRVLIATGGENRLMPVGITRHLGDDPAARAARMSAETPAAVADFHDAGAAVLVPHGESRSLDLLRQLSQAGLDGMEVYNLHANIDPTIRREWLNLPSGTPFVELAPWVVARPVEEGGPEPDLCALGFLEPNAVQLQKYDALLSEGFRLHAMLGSDIHENSVPQMLADGERGDSYRRLMRWFGNHLLVPDKGDGAPLTRAALVAALRAGRGYGVFELFGSPRGFDFHGRAGGLTVELGGELRGADAELRVRAPLLAPPPVGMAEAELNVRVLRIASQAPQQVVLSVTMAGSEGRELVLPRPEPGAYRVEISVVPHHLLPYLGELSPAQRAKFRRAYPYLYSSPIYVRAS